MVNEHKKVIKTALPSTPVVVTGLDEVPHAGDYFMAYSDEKLAKQVAEEVQNYFGKKVFATKIPRTVRISEAPGYGLPITEYEPNGKGAKAYRDLAQETIERYYAL